MNELERFENKQKLTNLQIEKRFVQMEEAFDQIKTKIEKLSVLENMPERVEKDVSLAKEQVETMKDEKKKEIEQISDLVESIDIGSVKKDIIELKTQVSEFKKRFDREIEVLQILENKVKDTSSGDKIHELMVKIKEVGSKSDSFGTRLSSLESEKLAQAIFIE